MTGMPPLPTQSLTEWVGGTSSIIASVVLDKAGSVSFTNLDQIGGRIIVRSGKAVNVDSITVKLEGESRTRLRPPGGDSDDVKAEYHKLLYQVIQVFPPARIVEDRNLRAPAATFTLPPGTHEYPFSFKLPFNNTCSQPSTKRISGKSEFGNQHVKQTLPPTLSGFPGEAEIRYFLKVTVNRHSVFKENPRGYAAFNFLPIEPPRPRVSGSEIFARQRHSFSAIPESTPTKPMSKGWFGKKPSSAPIASLGSPSFAVDARLPQFAILTCNGDIPLRLIVKKLDNHHGLIYLQSLQISLIGTTAIRARTLQREEVQSWIIVSSSNLGIPVGTASDPANTETVINDQMWRGRPLLNTIAPTFETCNIKRTYQLDVRVGLSDTRSMQGRFKVNTGETPRIPQNVVLPLRLDTAVYSGIAPPKQVLQRMADANSNPHPPGRPDPPPGKLQAEQGHAPGFGAGPSGAILPMPVHASASTAYALPAQPAMAHAPDHDDLPPSYEDAIAVDLPPVDGRRPEYLPPPAVDDEVLKKDEKRGWAG